MKRTFFIPTLFVGLLFSLTLVFAPSAQAATCSLVADEVIDQAYVTTNSCTSIEINANVSTTWIGTVDLGGGTVTVKSGFTMTMGSSSAMVLGLNDDFIVETGATTTHLPQDPNGLKISARNIEIDGALAASGKGCPHGDAFGGDGYGVDVSTGLCGLDVGGYGHGGGGSGAGGGGGSYASAGGGGGSSAVGGSTIYGNSFVPNFLGSGGGTGYYATAFGGAGGGLIQVTSTGLLLVNGAISVNGMNGAYDSAYNGGGGGAGGSLRISAATIAGSGTISADGGMGGAGGGGGSGGRVAVYYGAFSGLFSASQISADAGSGGLAGAWGNGADGGEGTTYLLNRIYDDGAGMVTITTGFDFPDGGDYTRDAFSILPGARLHCVGTNPLTVSSVGWLSLSNVTWSCRTAIDTVTLQSSTGLSTTNTTLTFSAATSVNITTPTWTNVTTTLSLTKSGARTTWDVSSDLTLRDFTLTTNDAGLLDANGGFLFLPRNIALTMVSSTLSSNVSSTLLTALSIDARSSINATDHGCPRSIGAYDGSGPDVSTGICGVSVGGYGLGGGGVGNGGSGAAHGGVGGNGGGLPGSTVVYGSSTNPVLFGSSGGGGYYISTAPGGGAGGIIHMAVSGVLTLEGSIKADGSDGVFGGSYSGGSGGSGGSINLSLGSLAGSGTLTANGGGGSNGGVGGGGGGGGRIALRYTGFSFTGTSSTAGGAAGSGGLGIAGGTGTIYTFRLNLPPNDPSALLPASLTSGSATGTNTPTFHFTLSDADVGDTVKYHIQIANDSLFTSPVVDYTSALGSQGSRSFQVGQSLGGGTYTVGSVSQTLSDGSYYWRVSAIDPVAEVSSYTTANSGSVAFVVDTAARTLQFENVSASGYETVPGNNVRVLLDATHFEPVTATYTLSGTASSSSDYVLSAGTITVSPGDTSTTIPFTLIDDGIRESSETLILTLSDPVNAILGTNVTYTFTILDNESLSSSPSGGGGGSSIPGSSGSAVTSPSFIGNVNTNSQTPSPQQGSPSSSSGDSSSGSGSSSSDASSDHPLPPPSAQTRAALQTDASDFEVFLTPADTERLGSFIETGTTDATRRLGSGERRAMVRDLLDTMRRSRISLEDLERLASGQIPRARNLAEERIQLPRVRSTFRSLYHHDPNFQNSEENLAWNTLMYRIRFPRDLTEERTGIRDYRALFGRNPVNPSDWATVRVMGYVQR